ncbi:velvet complex subunit B-like isoform X2 [Triticum dicoccoides]|uniref:velvet complex subunit B-like isoform X2 n=1 Tax=Triticum dicoccoides TaxID=85692 RepID=UPI001891A5D8|nr:velvet complex subunit B-like isoform X2 [Triticum dicoccoides]
MARATALCMFLVAARSISVHGAQYAPPPAVAFATSAAARAFSTHAAAYGPPAASSYGELASPRPSSAHAAAYVPPVPASRAIVGQALPPPGSAPGGPRLPRCPKAGALAALVGAGIYMALAPDDDEEDFPGAITGCWSTKADSSERDLRAIKALLQNIDRNLKNIAKGQQEQEAPKPDARCWKDILDDIIRKINTLISQPGVWKEFHTLLISIFSGLTLLAEMFGDPAHNFHCPFSGCSEVVYIFDLSPKDENDTGGSSNMDRKDKGASLARWESELHSLLAMIGELANALPTKAKESEAARASEMTRSLR